MRKITAAANQNSMDYFEGIDFWKADRLHIPDYTKCKNLIQNPSFESGLRYYKFASLGEYEDGRI